mmetsp:Transcript_4847/g.9065  ORF Transcript_4847/g.9065 Transcript_4847/m.9065 type:complete len:167 (-) Transcript_4847:1706-2206(-)
MNRKSGLAGMQWTFLKESFPRTSVRSANQSRRLSSYKPQSMPDIDIGPLVDDMQPPDISSLSQSIRTNPLEKSTVFDIDLKHRHQLNSLSAYNSIRFRSPKVSTASSNQPKTPVLRELPEVLKRVSVMNKLAKDPIFLRFCERVDETEFRRISSAPRRSSKRKRIQ